MNPLKRKIEMFLKTFSFFYKKQMKESIHDSVSNAANPVIKALYDSMEETLDIIKDYSFAQGKKRDDSSYKKNPEGELNRYRNMVRNPIEVSLAIVYKDSAFNDLFEYTAYTFLKKAQKQNLIGYLEGQLKDPEHMYFNSWQSTQEKTQREHDKDVLHPDLLSDSERLLVDEVNLRETNEYVDRLKKKVEEHRHW